MPRQTTKKLTSAKFSKLPCTQIDEQQLRNLAKNTFGSPNTPRQFRNLHLYRRSVTADKVLSKKTICKRLSLYHGSKRTKANPDKLLEKKIGVGFEIVSTDDLLSLALILEICLNTSTKPADVCELFYQSTYWKHKHNQALVLRYIKMRCLNQTTLKPPKNFSKNKSTQNKRESELCQLFQGDYNIQNILQNPKLKNFMDKVLPKVVRECASTKSD